MTHILRSKWNSLWNSFSFYDTAIEQKQPTQQTHSVYDANTNNFEKKPHKTITAIVMKSDSNDNEDNVNLIPFPMETSDNRQTRISVQDVLFRNSNSHYRPSSLTPYVSLPIADSEQVMWYNTGASNDTVDKKNTIASIIAKRPVFGPVLFLTSRAVDYGNYSSSSVTDVKAVLDRYKVIIKPEVEPELDLAEEFQTVPPSPPRTRSRNRGHRQNDETTRRNSKTRVKRVKFKDPPKVSSNARRKSKRIAKRKERGKAIKNYRSF